MKNPRLSKYKEVRMSETTKRFDTRIGDLFFDHDYPTNPTVQHLYDTMDFQRACQLYLWGLPIVAVARWRQAYHEAFDLQPNQALLTKTFQDRLGVLTINESTPYLFGFTNMAERPVVFDIPPGLVIGLTVDFWQQSVMDVGIFGANEGRGDDMWLSGRIPRNGLTWRAPGWSNQAPTISASFFAWLERRKRTRPRWMG
jgi:hypothetical protein